jgi:hypothetical protein
MKIKGMISCALMALGVTSMGQTMDDTLYSYRAETPVVVDGQATEPCWEKNEWHYIDQVWMPYDAYVDPDDFQGRFKVSWDPDYLYVLAEIVDDSLSDDWSNPIEHWWDDDCLEIFIDEDRSMGDHETNCNAFAYHVSLFFDALDLDSNGQGINYRSHVTADRDTIGEHTYLWEFAFKIHDETYNNARPEDSRVTLEKDKLMGLAVAYCDNDETTTRENFIGSMYMTAAHNNDMYRNADYFGPVVLVDSVSTGSGTEAHAASIRLWPNPARDQLHIRIPQEPSGPFRISLFYPDGRTARTFYGEENEVTFDVRGFESGIYFLYLSSAKGFSLSRRIVIE